MGPEAEVFEALRKGEVDRVKALLEAHPAWVNARNDNGDSLLLAAAYAGRRDLFEMLLRKGAAVNLFEATALGLGDRVASILEQDPAAVNSYSHDGWTPLHLAAFFGHAEIAARLISPGADVNARSRSERLARSNTPLHAAAANRQVGVAELLLAHGADANARDGSGFTPLGLAANSKNDLLVLLLLERGAQVSQQTVRDIARRRKETAMRASVVLPTDTEGVPYSDDRVDMAMAVPGLGWRFRGG